jgi:hypothetical protein
MEVVAINSILKNKITRDEFIEMVFHVGVAVVGRIAQDRTEMLKADVELAQAEERRKASGLQPEHCHGCQECHSSGALAVLWLHQPDENEHRWKRP